MNAIGENMLVLDRMNELGNADPLYAFALDELLCRSAGQGGAAICHIWRHPQAFVMGLRDSRMPYAKEAKQWLESNGWATIVRNSGGAAVPLDAGVVNLSLIIPNPSGPHPGFRNDFERMYQLIREALQGTGRIVDKGWIQGAYCPGDYDLSIDGRKFCGIAQRRQVHAAVIQAFIVAEGTGAARAEFVRSFYEIASGGDSSLGHPIVTGDSTASLEELAGLGPFAAFAFADAVKDVLCAGRPADKPSTTAAGLRMPEPDEIEVMMNTLRSRYAITES